MADRMTKGWVPADGELVLNVITGLTATVTTVSSKVKEVIDLARGDSVILESAAKEKLIEALSPIDPALEAIKNAILKAKTAADQVKEAANISFTATANSLDDARAKLEQAKSKTGAQQ